MRKMKLNLIGASLFSISAAFAGYDGPAVDINFVNTPPAQYDECEQYSNDSAKVYRACDFGIDEARRMAERFGGGNGRVAGYLRGFAWGMFKMTKAYQKDGDEMAKGAAAAQANADYQGLIQSGLAEGVADGNRRGSAAGKSEAVSRWEKAIDTGHIPSNQYVVPEVPYEGMDNAYQKLVGEPKTVMSIIKEDIAPQIGELKAYDGWDTIYLGEKKPLTVWELWFDDGAYVFEKAAWFDKDLAMKVWLDRPIDSKPKYERLNQDAPLIDPAHPEMGTRDLQAIFRKSFMNAYAYYVNYYFSSTFFKSMDDGQLFGEITGQQVGKRVAFETGLMQEFNALFKKSSKATFQDAFAKAYTDNFTVVYNDYLNNPKLSIDFTGIVGETDDGIIQPGERFAAQFSCRNAGGKGSDLAVGVSGDVVEATPAKFTIGFLMSKQFTASSIARINPRMATNSTANICLSANGIDDCIGQKVQRVIEVGRASARNEILSGRGTVTVSVTNITTKVTPGSVTTVLYVDGREASRQSMGLIEASTTETSALDYAHIDPVTFINRAVEAKVVVYMGNEEIDETTVSIGSSDRRGDITQYFDLLSNGKAYLPPQVALEERLAELSAWIAAANRKEIKNRSGKNVYSQDPSSTIPGRMVYLLRASHHDQNSLKAYQALGETLWKERTKFFKMGSLTSKIRISYEALVKELAPGVK